MKEKRKKEKRKKEKRQIEKERKKKENDGQWNVAPWLEKLLLVLEISVQIPAGSMSPIQIKNWVFTSNTI